MWLVGCYSIPLCNHVATLYILCIPRVLRIGVSQGVPGTSEISEKIERTCGDYVYLSNGLQGAIKTEIAANSNKNKHDYFSDRSVG